MSGSGFDPLPFDFTEFLSGRLGVTRDEASNLLGCFVRETFASKENSRPSVARTYAPEFPEARRLTG